MKNPIYKTTWVAVIAALLLFFACDKDGTDNGENQTVIDEKTAQTEAQIDQVSDEVSIAIDEAYMRTEFPEKRHKPQERYLPECATITHRVAENIKTVTIDFGDGCTLRNGHHLSGKIVFSYEKDTDAATRQLAFYTDNFTCNRKSIVAEGSIFRERSNTNGNFQSTKAFEITVTWPDGSFAKKEGTKVREKIAGGDTQSWGDDVFEITGSWKYTKKNGTVLSATVIFPLRRELACKFMVSGVLQLGKNNHNAILDYGAGACDDLATININDNGEREIHLGNW